MVVALEANNGHAITNKSLRQNKKTSEKALIPLPPTGLASFFYANPDVVQTNPQPRPAVGLCRGSAIAQNERFGREMKRGCTAALQAVTKGIKLECPDSLGENFENVGFGGFSKTRTIFFERRLTEYGGSLNSLQATTGGSCGVFDGFHRAEHDRRSVFPLCN